MKTVELSKLAEEMDLKNLTPEVDMSGVKVTTPEINRPALQLTGYLEHFEATRVQIIGYVEFSYLQHLDREARETAFERLILREYSLCDFYNPDGAGSGSSGTGKKA